MENLKGNMHKKLFALAILSFCELAGAQTSAHWVGTWAASPLSQTVNSGQPAPGNSTYRNIVHISMGGSSFRVQLTNEFGTAPITVEAAHIAASAGNGAIQASTDHALTFNGQTTVTIPAGALVVSDPVSMQAAPLS